VSAAERAGTGGPAHLDALTVFTDAPEAFAPRASWVLDTLLAPLGRRAALTRDPAHSRGAALVYAAEPVPGVPTIPCSRAAMELFAADRPLPPGAFAPRQAAAGAIVGAFPAREVIGGSPARDAAGVSPAAPAAGAVASKAAAAFTVPFDLVASAFALLACWDERTSADRDRFGRLPYSASVFAANPALRIEEPAVDAYVELLRTVLGPRLATLGSAPLSPAGWMWGAGKAGASYAIALTHDIDNLWRWTPRGFVTTGRRSAHALRHGNAAALGRELGDIGNWFTRHLPRRTDPLWTFPQMLAGEDARRVSSTFFVIARHTHPLDGDQPETYRKRTPEALALLNRHGREIGLHGNDSDRLGVDPLSDDRSLLARRAHAEVRGIRYHYLRCLYHETLPLLEQARFSYDTSLAFAEHEGFRCGCSFPFRPYHLGQQRPLDLVELPLAVMDGTLQEPHYRGLDAAAAESAAAAVLDLVDRSGGAVSILWHNNRFDRHVARGYDDVYWRLVDRVSTRGGWAAPAGDIVARWRAATGMKAPDSLQGAGAYVCASRVAATARAGGGS